MSSGIKRRAEVVTELFVELEDNLGIKALVQQAVVDALDVPGARTRSWAELVSQHTCSLDGSLH